MRLTGIIARGLLALGLCVLADAGAEAKRLALVIGNDAYTALPPLKKAVGDAKAVSAALKRLGFEVSEHQNLTYKSVVDALADFEAKVEAEDEVVVHYSGHGVAIEGGNYLLPVDLKEPKPGQESAVKKLAIDAADIVESIRAKNPRYVFAIIDACRDTPFKPVPGRTSGRTRGLARMDADPGAFILFSAGPGEQALDALNAADPSPTSVFTRILLRHIEKPDLTLQGVAKITQEEVVRLAATIKHKQFPDYSDRTLGVIRLPAGGGARGPVNEDDKAYDNAVTANSVEAYEAYLAAWKQGRHVAEAQLQIKAIKAEGADRAIVGGPTPLTALRTLEGHSHWVRSVALTADGKILASASMDDSIKLWDMATGKLLRTLDGHLKGVQTVAFAPDGRRLASGGDDETIRLWDVETGRQILSIEANPGGVQSVAFSPDGKHLASAGGWDKSVRIWNPGTGQFVRKLDRHSQPVLTVAFSPNGRWLASGASDRTARLWEWDPEKGTGKLVRTLDGHTSSVQAVAFSADSRTLATGGGDRNLKAWDVETGGLLKTIDRSHTGSVLSLAFSPDGRTLASASDDMTARLWNYSSQQLIRPLEGHTGGVRAVVFTPDGKNLATGSWDKTIKIWDAATGQAVRALEGHADWVWSVTLTPEGRTLVAAGAGDKTVKIWDATTGQLIRTLEGHLGDVRAVAFSPDGKILASGGADSSVRLWDVATGRTTGSLEGHAGEVQSLAFSSNGRLLASGGQDKNAILWDMGNKGQRLTTLAPTCGLFASACSPGGHGDWIQSVVFSPDGRTLATASKDQTIKLWDVPAGALRRTLTGHSDWVQSVAFASNGLTLASASKDRTVKLWDVNDGQAIRTLEEHADDVQSVAFSPDGRLLATGSRDKTVRIWSASGDLTSTLVGHSDDVQSVAFASDSRTLASGEAGRGVRLWNVAKESVSAMIRILPADEWIFIGEQGYVASGGAHDYLQMDGEAPVDETFRRRWLKTSLLGTDAPKGER